MEPLCNWLRKPAACAASTLCLAGRSRDCGKSTHAVRARTTRQRVPPCIKCCSGHESIQLCSAAVRACVKLSGGRCWSGAHAFPEPRACAARPSDSGILRMPAPALQCAGAVATASAAGAWAACAGGPFKPCSALLNDSGSVRAHGAALPPTAGTLPPPVAALGRFAAGAAATATAAAAALALWPARGSSAADSDSAASGASAGALRAASSSACRGACGNARQAGADAAQASLRLHGVRQLRWTGFPGMRR